MRGAIAPEISATSNLFSSYLSFINSQHWGKTSASVRKAPTFFTYSTEARKIECLKWEELLEFQFTKCFEEPLVIIWLAINSEENIQKPIALLQFRMHGSKAQNHRH